MADEYPELLPPENDPMVGYRVFELLEEIIQDKDQLGLPKKWNLFYELRKGKHWKTKRQDISLVTANLLATHVQRTTNLLTDNNPTFNVVPVGPIPEDRQDVIDQILWTAEHWWSDQEQQHVFEKSVDRGETYGVTVEKVIFNPDIEYGLGEVETLLVDPFFFGFYPVDLRESLQKAEAVFHFWPMTLREAKRRWNGFADKIKCDEELLSLVGDERREIAGGVDRGVAGYLSTFASAIKKIWNNSGYAGDSNKVLVCECWCKDYTMAGDVPKYQGYIRRVTACNAGEVVLDDRSNPSISPMLQDEMAQQTYLYDKYPFSLTVSVNDPSGVLWGMGDFEQLQGLQAEFNKTISQFTLLKDKAARSKLILPKTSNVKPSELTNVSGIIQPTNAMEGQGIRYMEPPRISPDILKGLEIYKDFFFLVSGAFELDQAADPGKSVIAYKAIAALMERATVMLKGKSRNYSKMVRERGRMYVSHVQNWYSEDRWVTYDDDGEDQSIAVRGEMLLMPAKITVVSGSTMPRSKVQQREEALELYARGAIDQKALLKAIEFPGWKQIVERMQAGPVGEMLEKLAGVGVPQELVQYFAQVGQMDPKDIQRGVEGEQIPAFMDLLMAAMQGQPPEKPEDTKARAESELKAAQAQKTVADIGLVEAKIRSELVGQEVQMAGVKFDRAKIEMELMKTMSAIRSAQEKASVEGYKTATDIVKTVDQVQNGPYRERGMSSNNKVK